MTSDRCRLIDVVHDKYCIFRVNLIKMAFSGHSGSSAMSFFVRSPVLSIIDRKNYATLVLDKIAEMTLKVDQGHWRWYNN